MKIQDLVGLSKPLVRLIEVLGSGVGAVSAPYLIRRTADAKAYEIKIITDALGEARKKHNLPVVYQNGEIDTWQSPKDGTLIIEETTVSSRVESRVAHIEAKRQHNIEAIASAAARELADESDVPELSPDEDWVSRFFAHSQDVSSKQMQSLWGRILAGEVKNPGSYSLRTLDFIRNLSQSEAKVFESVGKLALMQGKMAFVVADDKKWLASQKQIPELSHFLLGELGIMYSGNVSVGFFDGPQIEEVSLINGNNILVINRGEISKPIGIEIWKFSTMGFEMLSLLEIPSDEEYIEKIAKIFTEKMGEVTWGTISERLGDGNISYNIVKRYKPPSATPKESDKIAHQSSVDT